MKSHRDEKFSALDLKETCNMIPQAVYESLKSLIKQGLVKYNIMEDKAKSHQPFKVYYYNDNNITTTVHAQILTEELNADDQKFFNKLFFRIEDLKHKTDNLMLELSQMNDIFDNLRISHLQKLEDYYNKEKLRENMRSLKYKIRKLKGVKY